MGPIPRSALGLALAFAFASPAFAGNYAECIIDKMPGVANDTAATAVYQMCKSEYPGAINSVPQGSGRGMFSFKSGAECTAKKAGETRSNRAAVLVGVACRKLYDEIDWERGTFIPPPASR